MSPSSIPYGARMPRISSCYHGPVRRGCRGDSWIPHGAAFLVLSCVGPVAEPSPMPPSPEGERPRPRSELIDRARAWPRAFDPFVSGGHGDGSYVIDIRVSPPHLGAFRDLVLGQSMPVGTTVVAFHTRAAAGAESSYAMKKTADREWEFLVADPKGGV